MVKLAVLAPAEFVFPLCCLTGVGCYLLPGCHLCLHPPQMTQKIIGKFAHSLCHFIVHNFWNTVNWRGRHLPLVGTFDCWWTEWVRCLSVGTQTSTDVKMWSVSWHINRPDIHIVLMSNCKYMDINIWGQYDVKNVSHCVLAVEKLFWWMCDINLMLPVDVNVMLTVDSTKTFICNLWLMVSWRKLLTS